jgi:hypothetical protein
MKHLSIFEGVVRGEDAYTNLLRNLMLADLEYGKAICKLLMPDRLNFPYDQCADIRSQVSLRAANVVHGRADLLIETRAAVLLVEVKTDLYCSLTDGQHFGLDDSGNPKIKGYLQYLEQKRLGGARVGLCVLAPRQWLYRSETEGQLKQLAIPARLVTWEELCARTMNSQFTGIVNEFGAFLESNFMSISFGADESSLVTSDAGLAVLGGASLKLHELVKQAARELKVVLTTLPGRSYEVKELWSDAREHGATVYQGGKPVLWFGTWDVTGWPLVIGFEEKWEVEESLNVKGLNGVAKPILKWKTYQMPTECFKGEAPLSHIVQTLKAVLQV